MIRVETVLERLGPFPFRTPPFAEAGSSPQSLISPTKLRKWRRSLEYRNRGFRGRMRPQAVQRARRPVGVIQMIASSRRPNLPCNRNHMQRRSPRASRGPSLRQYAPVARSPGERRPYRRTWELHPRTTFTSTRSSILTQTMYPRHLRRPSRTEYTRRRSKNPKAPPPSRQSPGSLQKRTAQAPGFPKNETGGNPSFPKCSPSSREA